MKPVLLASVLSVAGAVSALAQDVEPVEVTLISGGESSFHEYAQLIPEGDERYSVANVCFDYETGDGEVEHSFGGCVPFAELFESNQNTVVRMLTKKGYDIVPADEG